MKALALITTALLVAAFALDGTAPLGRLLLAVQQPALAVKLFQAPSWRGVAHFRSGSHEAAAGDFAKAREFYNLGNAQAFAGNHAAALEAYDVAIAQGDAMARANFDVVAAHYGGLVLDPETLALFPRRQEGPTAEAEVGQGDGRAAGTGDGVTNNTMLGQTELLSRGKLGVRRVFDDQFMIADDRWLLQLEDVPGAFMAERIVQEHKRRRQLGLSPPPPEDGE